MIVREDKGRAGVVILVIDGIMLAQPQDAAEGDSLARVEQMIDGAGEFRAVAFERIGRIILSVAKFKIAVGETAAGQAQAQIRVRTKRAADAQFRIQINRGDGQAQGQIALIEIRLVVIIKHIAGDGRGPLQRLVETELEKLARLRINLSESSASRPKQARHEQHGNPNAMHPFSVYHHERRHKGGTMSQIPAGRGELHCAGPGVLSFLGSATVPAPPRRRPAGGIPLSRGAHAPRMLRSAPSPTASFLFHIF
jgi:hypothetical protein